MRDNFSILLQDVSVEIEGNSILESINWQVCSGEKWVLLGPNGSGKTSLLRLITGYSYPSRGLVRVMGCRFGRVDLRELRKKIGWVHSDLRTMVPEFMTSAEVVLAGERGSIAYYGEPRAGESETARRQLAAVGAVHLAGRRFSTLSTGERQRVLIARALLATPDILLLDEPCLGLDPLARESFLDSLMSLYSARPDLTTIYVTHHVEEIRSNYDGVLILDQGHPVSCGNLSESLTSDAISRLFGRVCRVSRSGGRYSLHFR